jgi:hypothetical protein
VLHRLHNSRRAIGLSGAVLERTHRTLRILGDGTDSESVASSEPNEHEERHLAPRLRESQFRGRPGGEKVDWRMRKLTLP